MKKISVILMCCLLTFSVVGQAFTTFRIDPSQAFGGTASEYFSEVEYIPLETTKESTFGFVYDYIITDSSIVVNDPDTRSVLFFSDKGRFITKVKDNINEVRIDKDHVNNEILVLLFNPATVKLETRHYSLTGKFLYVQKENISLTEIKTVTNLAKEYTVKFNSCRILGKVPEDSTRYLISIFHHGRLTKSFLPVNQVKDVAFCSIYGVIDLPNIILDRTAYFTTPFNFDLYKLTKDTLIRIGKFVFPADRSVPPEVINSKDINYLKSQSVPIYNTKTIRSVGNIFYKENLLFFKINAWRYNFSTGSAAENQYNFILDTISSKLVSIERITPDEKTHFLPICENTIKIYGLRQLGDWVYTNVSSFLMFSEYEKNRDRNPDYPSELMKYFETQNRKSNPVVVRMRLK